MCASAYDFGGSWAVGSRSMFVVGIVGVGADVVSVELNMPCTPNAFHLSENHCHIKAPLIAHHSIIPTVIVVAADLYFALLYCCAIPSRKCGSAEVRRCGAICFSAVSLYCGTPCGKACF